MSTMETFLVCAIFFLQNVDLVCARSNWPSNKSQSKKQFDLFNLLNNKELSNPFSMMRTLIITLVERNRLDSIRNIIDFVLPG